MSVRHLFLLSPLLLCCLLVFAFRHIRADGKANGFRKHGNSHKHRHGSWISIDYFAYSSAIRHWSPAFKVILSVLMILLCIVLDNVYVSFAILLSAAFLTVEIGRLPLREYLAVLMVPIVFVLLSILAIVVDFSGRSVLPVGGYGVSLGFGCLYTTPEMLESGGGLLLKILAAVSALQMMVLSTPSTEFLSVLKRTHLPKELIDLMHMIYRYIFILLEMFGKMSSAAQSRLGYRDFKTSCRTFSGVAGNLLVVSIKKSRDYYNAMEARCYDGELLFLEEEKKVKPQMILPAAAYVLYLLLLWHLTR